MTTRSDFAQDPAVQLLQWYNDAVAAKIKNPDAMTLASATRGGVPSARIVLYKGMNEKGIRFYTNYHSPKGRELKANPKAALVFYWSSLDRQLRVEGKVEPLKKAESDAYWNTRSRDSRLSALASKQSGIIAGREVLEQRVQELTEKYEGKDIPRPSHWGGFCLIPTRFEFWLAGDHRLHDRFCYLKKKNKWELVQLSP